MDIPPPCPQQLTVTTDCDKVEKDLNWGNPPDCPTDNRKYCIYYSHLQNEDLSILDSVTDPYTTNYIHFNPPSIADCYAVIAIDSVGNHSEFNNMVCVSIDSCSTYRRPNIFLLNQSDDINNKFKPYPYTSVERIELKVFNRRGRIIFETTDPEINWDGKNMNNVQECSDRAYFYVCDVYESTLIALRKCTLTGSVTVLR